VPLVGWINGNLLRYPFFSLFNRPPAVFRLETERGLMVVENPLPKRTGILFLHLLALAGGEREIEIGCGRLLRSLPFTLYGRDFSRILPRLEELKLHFEGSFFARGDFRSRKDLRLVEEIQLPQDGKPLYVRFSPWVLEDSLPFDMDLFHRLPLLAKRFYLYFVFGLWRGAFAVGEEHFYHFSGSHPPAKEKAKGQSRGDLLPFEQLRCAPGGEVGFPFLGEPRATP